MKFLHGLLNAEWGNSKHFIYSSAKTVLHEIAISTCRPRLSKSYALEIRLRVVLLIYENRIKNKNLKWVKQIIKILKKNILTKKRISLNDLGCNLFQLYKG